VQGRLQLRLHTGARGCDLGGEERAFEPHILQPAHAAAVVVAHEQRHAAHVVELGQAERELRLVRHGGRHVQRVRCNRSLHTVELHVAVDVQLDGAWRLVRMPAVHLRSVLHFFRALIERGYSTHHDCLYAHSAHERDVQDELRAV
jgi:hypothetical protein